jgi:hypothetical protein
MSNSMTRQHFRALADAIHEAELGPEERATVARAIAGAVRQFNDRFDSTTFMEWATGGRPVPQARTRTPRPRVTTVPTHPRGGHHTVVAQAQQRAEELRRSQVIEADKRPSTAMDRLDPWSSSILARSRN